MRTIRLTLATIGSALGCLRELLGYGLKFLLAMRQPQAVLAARLLAVESQLAIHMRRIRQRQEPRPRFTAGFRFLWVAISKLWGGWEARSSDAAGHGEALAHHLRSGCSGAGGRDADPGGLPSARRRRI